MARTVAPRGGGSAGCGGDDGTGADDGGGRSQRSPERVAPGGRPGRRRAAGRARPHREPPCVDDRRASRRRPSRRSRRRDGEGTHERARVVDAAGPGASVRRVSRVARPSRPPRDGVLRARPVRTFPPLRARSARNAQMPATATDADAPPPDAGDRVVERPLVPSRRREPTERSAGAVARTGASRSVPFRRSATSRAARASFCFIVTTFGTRRSAPFPPKSSRRARGRATTRPLVAHSLVRRAPPPQTMRAGSSPARLAPSRARVPPPPRAPPPRGCRDVPTC